MSWLGHLVFLLPLFGCIQTYDPPLFMNGRPRDGFLAEPLIEDTRLLENVAQSWFTQKLDHYNDGDTRTWSQRYYVNNIYAVKNGPVFLYVGGEGPLTYHWLAGGSMVDYARENGAYIFGLEHRYYGESHPLPDLSVANLKYLSSEQGLSDLATFRVAMAKQYGLEDNKWILFGGSYPGALSAWFRYKYPHLAHGAVATSAPMKAVLDFPEYLDVSTQSLSNDQCRQNVKEATTLVEKFVRTESGRKMLSQKFDLCAPLTRNQDDIRTFTSGLANNFFGIIQYNKDNRVSKGAPNGNITIRVLCSMMSDKRLGNVMDRYAAINRMMLKVYRQKCLDVSYANYIKYLRNTEWSSSGGFGMRQWTYQTCTEFGYFQSTDSKKQVFGTTWPISYFLKACIDIYGPVFNATENQRGIDWTNAEYGGYKLAKSATRIIFPNGSIDPWHALSFLKDEHDIIAIFIKGTSHCANMYPKSVFDSPELAAAKQRIGDIVRGWLK